MSSLARALGAGVAAATLVSAAPAFAAFASASLSSNHVSNSVTKPGHASASNVDVNGVARASAYEFTGGVGVSANTYSTVFNVGSITTFARASAGASETFVIRPDNIYGVPDDDFFDRIYFIDFNIIAQGSVASSNATFPTDASYHSQASASYNYSWQVGDQRGAGNAYSDKLLRGRNTDFQQDGPLSATISGVGLTQVPMSFGVSAVAGVLGFLNTPASADVSFQHTLRWGGVSAVRATDLLGNSVDLPDGFRLSLIGETTGFDYWNPAGPNPYFASAPEPSAWALMILGFGGAGAALRRRRLRIV